MKHKVYLFGALLGQTFREAVYWRKFAERFFSPYLESLSPMRGLAVHNPNEPMQAEYEQDIMHQAKGFTTRDLMDIRRSDLLFGYFGGTKRASIGSMIEVGYATALNKPVIVVIPDVAVNPHIHPMVQELTITVPTMLQGLSAVMSLMLPGEILSMLDLEHRYNEIESFLYNAEEHFWTRG